jgi:type II secretory pathway component PulJ
MPGELMKTQMNKQTIRNSGIRTFRRQAGVTLIEAMISLALSLIVTSAMVVLMANSMGTSTRIIHMSQLTDELRNAMSMMTRDVRRANYSANSIFCYGYSKCGFAGGDAVQAGDILPVDTDADGKNDCFTFSLDRNFDGDSIDIDPNDNDGHAGFRRVPSLIDPEIFVIEMWTGAAFPNCATAPVLGDDWIELTDPNTVNIMEFTINDDGSIEKEIAESKTSTFNTRQREIQISLEGELVLEQQKGNVVVVRRLEDKIYVRNDFVLETI